jgi:two-component system sensor histidine kinase/response regulator
MTKNEKEIIATLNETLSMLTTGLSPEVASIAQFDEQVIDPAILSLVNNVNSLTSKYNQANDFINALSNGDLSIDPPPRNNLVSSFKQLHANLQHLTWQTQQIAKGDYNQEVSFMGDFSVAFNTMTKSLKEKQRLDEQLLLYAKELEQANNTKDKLFSIISHDLKGPFNVVLGFAKLLHNQYDEYSVETRKKFILAIKESAESTYSLLEKLFTWSRTQRSEIKAKPQKIELKKIADSTLVLLKNIAADKNIAIINRIDPDTSASADEEMINTIMLNLISNALKFTHINGNIIIENSRKDTAVQISIMDDGVGIPQANIDNLFKIKSTFSTLGTAKERGTGLGLIICKEFININGGEIWVESQPNKGSKFIFTLPSA